jgi:hypothetical protein
LVFIDYRPGTKKIVHAQCNQSRNLVFFG